MNRVFVSYSRRNKTFAERIARDLSDAGLDVWIDFRQIQGGELWQDEIYRGIDRSDIVVACLSPDAVVSEWVQREILTARQKGKYIIPVMAANALPTLQQTEAMRWLLDVHFINFDGRYEAAFPELLSALPGLRRVGPYDDIDPAKIPNPFKGLEAFQQTDSQFFFGREDLIAKSLRRLREDRPIRFLAVVGASGSGKSSLVRAGVIPAIRRGELPGSDQWPVVIFTPGAQPTEALATRLAPLMGGSTGEVSVADLTAGLRQSPETLNTLVDTILVNAPESARLVLVVDQFEEAFTRAAENETDLFLKLLSHAVTVKGGRTMVMITMRADFFGRLSRYPHLAELFEQENMVIVTEMTPANIRRAIEGPAQAVGLVLDDGLTDRILDDVRRQPGSLPLLQYALKELYEKRDGRRLTIAAYEAVGGVKRALAQHAEDIYRSLNAAQQSIMRRVLLQLVEVGETGEATRRRVNRNDLLFRGVPDEAVQELIDLMTAPESRLLVASREIKPSADEQSQPIIWLDVSHEALIREWERFTGWVAENVENLRYATELLQAAHDWDRGRRDTAYLLTGNRLARAEAWLESADANPLQRDFVQASLQEAERREALRQEQQTRELELQRRAARILRYFVAVLLVSLVVAVALTVFALNNLNLATEAAAREKQAADHSATLAAISARSADEARSLALASAGQQAYNDLNTALGLALAVQGNQIANPPPQAQRVLAEVAYAPGLRRKFGPDSGGHQGAVTSVAYSPDGKTALSASMDNTIILWDLTARPDENPVIRRFGLDSSGTPVGHTAGINSVAFSPDGKTALSASADRTLILWDLTAPPGSDGILRRFEGHIDTVFSVAYSPDGLTAVSGSADDTLILWDLATGSVIRTFGANDGSGSTRDVLDVAFSPDGRRIVAAAANNVLNLWDVQTGELIRRFGGADSFLRHTSRVWSVAFSPNGAALLSASADGTLILWDAESGQAIRRFGNEGQLDGASSIRHDGAVFSAAFSPDGLLAVSGSEDQSLIIWNVSTGRAIRRFESHIGNVLSVAFSPDGRTLLSGASGDYSVLYWDLQQAEEIRRFEGHNSSVYSVAFSPDGRTALSGSLFSPESSAGTPFGDLRLWDVRTGRTIQQFLGHSDWVYSAVFTPDGRSVLSASGDGTLRLWDIATGAEVRRFEGHTDTVYAVVLTPDGQRALSASRDKTLILWEVSTGQIIRRFGDKGGGHTGAVFAVAISPDGSKALSASADKLVILWDVETGNILQRFTKHTRSVRTVAFSPDGQTAVSGSSDQTLIQWDIATGSEIQRFTGHTSTINSVVFSPDGQFVLSGSVDGTIRLWDKASGFELRRYVVEGSFGGVLSVAFSPDGLSMMSGLVDGGVRLWRVLPSVTDLLDWTFLNRVVNELACSERRQFGVQPGCDANGVFPTRTPYPLPTATAAPDDLPKLVVGAEATVNTTNGDNLRVRRQPGLAAEEITRIADGTRVTLLEGPRAADGLIWWRIRTPQGAEGWSVESVDNEQTLVP